MSEHGIETLDELTIGVSVDKVRNQLTIRFTTPISWIKLTPAEAFSFSQVILRKLKELNDHAKN